MIRAYLKNQPFTDAVNALNVGQVPGLPLGACIETLGVVDGLGVRPLMVPEVPEPLLEIMRPGAICQEWLTEGILRDDADLQLQALYRDPLCAHLKPHEVRQMAKELAEANRPFLRSGK
jgi:alpha-galactosidase